MKRMTIAVMALVVAPALASAQDSTRQQTDTSRTSMQAQDTARSRTTGVSRGRRSGSMGLSRDQVMQLQTALSGAGCDAGTADGILGPKTRRAMACARQKNNVTTNADLYRALGLDFATSGTSGTTGGARSRAGARTDSSTRSPARATDSTLRDSTRRDSTRRDSTRRDSTQRDTTSH